MAGSASVSGLASGLDTATIISQLMQLEAQPQARLKTRVGTEQTAITALQGFNTKFSLLASKAADLAKASNWSPVTATSSYDKVTVSSSGAATATTLDFKVVQTASTHRLAFANTAALTDAVVPAGQKLVLDNIDGNALIDIPTGNGTLQSVVDGINQAGKGIRATVVKLDTGYRLRVESTTTGLASDFKLKLSDGATPAPTLTDLLGGASETVAGQDAKITVGTDTMSSTSNTFTGLLPGVDVTLAADAAPQAVHLDIKVDSQKVSDAVKGLVDQVNSLLTDIDAATQTGAGKTAGVLAGDANMRSLRDQLVDSVYAVVGGTMSAVGVQLDRSAQFTFDASKFQEAYKADPVKTAAYFTTAGKTGFADRLAAVAKGASDSATGTLTTAISGRKTSVDQLNKDIADWDIRLALRQTTLSNQFTALETAMNQMNSQSSWLAGQISSLPKMS